MSMKLEVVVITIGFIAYFVDVALDWFLVYKHGRAEDYYWMGWTIFIILFSALLNAVVTCITILPKTSAIGVTYSFATKIVGVTMSTFTLGPLFWDINSWDTIRKSKSSKETETLSDGEEKESEENDQAHDSMKMGKIQRGLVAFGSNIPQWTAQLYIMGNTNKISLIQLGSLMSSLVGTTFSVIVGTHAVITTWADFRGRSNGVWGLSFLLFGGWMILAMMSFLTTIAFFSAAYGGGFIFLFVPLFYVLVFGQFYLLTKGKDKAKSPEFFQRISIFVQILICALTFVLLKLWHPSTTFPIEVLPKLTQVDASTSKLELILEPSSLTPITLGIKNDNVNDISKKNKYKGPGRHFTASVEILSLEKMGNNTVKFKTSGHPTNLCTNHQPDCAGSFVLRLNLTESPDNRTATRFLANSCKNEKTIVKDLSFSDLRNLWRKISEVDVYCLSQISDSMVVFLIYMDGIWLCYHIFLVISMDWVFWQKPKNEEEGEEVKEEMPMSQREAGRNVYVTQNAAY